jgi:hypothetical protein
MIFASLAISTILSALDLVCLASGKQTQEPLLSLRHYPQYLTSWVRATLLGSVVRMHFPPQPYFPGKIFYGSALISPSLPSPAGANNKENT